MILGDDAVIKFYDDGEFKLYGCARSCSLDIATDMIETSVTGKGVNRTFKPTANSFTGSMEGLINLDNPDLISARDLIEKQLNHVLMNVQFLYQDDATNQLVIEADFYISSSSLSAAIDTATAFSLEMRGTGNITTTLI